jgi:hypothetical protein
MHKSARTARRRVLALATGLGLAAGALAFGTALAGPRAAAAHDLVESIPAPPAAGGPSADELAQRWFDQLLGFDALEAYEARSGSRRLEFVVARRWQHGLVKILIDLRAPKAMSKIAFLLLQNRQRSFDVWVYLPPSLRPATSPFSGAPPVHRLPPMATEFPLPVAGFPLPIGELRPFLAGELVHRRLPDADVDGEPCYGIESRPVAAARFEKLELCLSKRTGVSLLTTYFRDGAPIRRIRVAPADVRQYEGRWLPERRKFEMLPEQEQGELILRNLMIDPQLPDRLFTEHNLKIQRFPSF